jgi:uncharacterized radical SAM superfamily Fe-S cluster-containing enzyme
MPINNKVFMESAKPKFSELLAQPEVKARWEKVRKYFFLRESTYDMSNRCNIRCDGCYYFEGEKQFAKEIGEGDAWRKLMQAEKARGITYVVLAGAEPSLVPELLDVCYQEMPLGSIATNGYRKIPESAGYKIHISVWGNDVTSLRVRKAKNLLKKQIENYKNDPRAVFVYTFTRENIDEVKDVAAQLVAHGCKLTFNVFSSPVGYTGNLRHDDESFARTRQMMIELLNKYPQNVVFSVTMPWRIPIKKVCTIFTVVHIPAGILHRISVWEGLSGNTGRILIGTGLLPVACRIRIAPIAVITPPVPRSSRRAFTVM